MENKEMEIKEIELEELEEMITPILEKGVICC
jgi:hypothetical protein